MTNSPVKFIQRRNDEESAHLRTIAGLSLAGMVDFIPVSLYQLGIIKHLPDPGSKIFDSDKVNASSEAQVLGIPDGPVSMAMYAANVALAGAAISKGKGTRFYQLAMAGIAIGQAIGGAYYLYNMIKVQKKICLYCVTGAAINFAMLWPLKNLFFNAER